MPFALSPDQYTETLGKGNISVLIGIFLRKRIRYWACV